MAQPANVQSTATRARAFAEYLKAHPDAEGKSPEALGREFGLEQRFVSQVLRGLSGSKGMSFDTLGWLQKVMQVLQGTWSGVRSILRRSFAFSAVTLTLSYLVLILATIQLGPGGLPVVQSNAALIAAPVMSATFVAQFVSFFISGDVRAALRASALLGVSLLALFGVFLWLAPQQASVTGAVALFSFVLVTLSVTVTYGVLATLSAGSGALVQFWRADREEQHMTRQQLLERLFDLQNRFANASPAMATEGRMFLPNEVRRFFALHPLRAAVAYGLFSGMTQLALGFRGEADFRTVHAVGITGAFVMDVIAYLAMGFTAKTLLEAWVRSVVSLGTVALLTWLPVNGFGAGTFQNERFAGPFVTKGGVYLILAAVGWMVARLDERTGMQTRLARNDPATLLAEIVRLELRLRARSQQVALVSVDAARSAEMKAMCDPLVAEYSFREYQDFLKHITEANHGFVYSTAGDGAILAFSSVSSAFLAAKEIQTGISYFNEHVNKLTTKFRLRVGLHVGEVNGDIREVEFTEVIDVAAHIQEAAPIRGILVSKPAALQLEGESLIPLKDPVDRIEVFLAYNPTVEM